MPGACYAPVFSFFGNCLQLSVLPYRRLISCGRPLYMGVAAVGRVGQRNPVRKGARNFGGRCLAPCSGSGFRCVLEGLYGSDVPIYPGFDKIVHICPIQKRKHMSVRWFCVPAVASGLRAFLCFRRVCADVIGKPDGGRPPCDARSFIVF